MTTTRQIPDLRTEVDRLISAGSVDLASALLAELWRKQPGTVVAPFLVSRFEQMRGKVQMTPLRAVLLRSFTVEPAVPLLRAEAFVRGIDLSANVGDFNAFAQEILDSASALYSFEPQAVILAVRTPDIAPDLWTQYADLAPDSIAASIQRVSESFGQWIRAFREHTSAA